MIPIFGDDIMSWKVVDNHHLEKSFEFPDFAIKIKGFGIKIADFSGLSATDGGSPTCMGGGVRPGLGVEDP